MFNNVYGCLRELGMGIETIVVCVIPCPLCYITRIHPHPLAKESSSGGLRLGEDKNLWCLRCPAEGFLGEAAGQVDI